MKINFKIKNKEKEIKLLVSEKVFKPTQTTKLLLEQSTKKIKKKKLKILDMGCGSGVIGIYILKKYKNINLITFSDISKESTNLTRKNLIANKINKKKFEVIKSDTFENLNGKKFDIIINDVSGISSEVSKLSEWFKNVPCDTGKNGTELTEKIIRNYNNFLNNKGILLLPIISLSKEKRIFDLIKKLKLQHNLLSLTRWPLPQNMYKKIDKLRSLKKLKLINYEEKYNLLIANTKIIQIKKKT